MMLLWWRKTRGSRDKTKIVVVMGFNRYVINWDTKVTCDHYQRYLIQNEYTKYKSLPRLSLVQSVISKFCLSSVSSHIWFCCLLKQNEFLLLYCFLSKDLCNPCFMVLVMQGYTVCIFSVFCRLLSSSSASPSYPNLLFSQK